MGAAESYSDEEDVWAGATGDGGIEEIPAVLCAVGGVMGIASGAVTIAPQ